MRERERERKGVGERDMNGRKRIRRDDVKIGGREDGREGRWEGGKIGGMEGGRAEG